jgi:hypothetical protein
MDAEKAFDKGQHTFKIKNKINKVEQKEITST